MKKFGATLLAIAAFLIAVTVGLSVYSNRSDSPVDAPSQTEPELRARAKVAVDEAIVRRVPTTTVSLNCRDHRYDIEPGDMGGYAVEEVWYGQITKKLVGGFMRCGGVLYAGYQLPTKWQPHMKVLVRWVPAWTEDRSYTIERYTTIPYYKEPGAITVHFFSKDRVRVVASDIGPEGENHPIHPDALEPPPEVDGELEQPPNAPKPPMPPKQVERIHRLVQPNNVLE